MSPTVILIRWIILVSSPCLSVNSNSNGEKPGSHHPLPVYLVVQFQHTDRAVSGLLTHILMGNHFITAVPCIFAVPLLLVLQIPWFSKVTKSAPFPPFLSVRLFHTFPIQYVRFSGYNLHSFLGSSWEYFLLSSINLM